ncbi:MAG: DUF1311 domain-containing protein [Oceanospirillaceae bacterium]|nr:DUF1311 domain-containing protein [Oceanospirillaceae bacterium]
MTISILSSHTTGRAITVCFVMSVSLNLSFAQQTSDFRYKTIGDFLTLEAHESTENFEFSIRQYEQNCLDNSDGGSNSVRCFLSHPAWDRELNIYYQRLMQKLNEGDKLLLRNSQRDWIKMRDSSIALHSSLLKNKYPDSGSMYVAMRANDSDQRSSSMTRERALTLKSWYESIVGQNERNIELKVQDGKFVTKNGIVPVGCLAQLKTELNGDNSIAAIYLQRPSLRGCMDANYTYPGGDVDSISYNVIGPSVSDTFSVDVCETVDGSLGKYCDRILVKFTQREYRVGESVKLVLSLEKLGQSK